MALFLDRLVFEMGLDSKEFVKGQRDAVNSFRRTREAATKDAQGIEQAADKASESISRLARNFVKLFALFTAGRGVGQFVSDINSADAALGRLSTSIGQAPELISAMSKAVERSGGNAQDAAQSFKTWADNVEQIRTTGDSSILPFLARLQAAGGKTIDLNKKSADGLADLADNLKAVADQQGIASATYYGKNLGFDEGTIALLVKGGAALRAALKESEKLGIATKKDTEAAQALSTAYASLTQEFEGFGRMIWTAVSPALVQIIKDIQSAVRWVKEWTQVNIVPYLKEFTEAMGVSGSSTRAFFVACELLIGLWIGSKGIAFLRALGTLRALLVGGRLMGAGAGAATAATAASGGLMGAIMSGLGVGAAAAAANSQNILAPPERSQSWHEAIVRAADPGIANRIYGSRAGGGEPTLMGRASGAVRRMLGLGGGAAGGSGGSMPAVPESVPMTAAERNTLGLIMKHESGGQNTMNYVGRSQGLDPTTPKGATAQGYFQMLNSNWRRIAPLYGIKTPNAMASSLEDQTKVALHLLRNGGVQNWTNYNPALRAAIARGDTAPAGGPAAAPAGPITGAKEVAGGVHPLGGGGRFKDGFGMRRHPIHGDIRMHAGVDLAAPAGTNVQAMASGTISIGRSGDVTVRHADGTSTSYRHVVPSVKEGDQVAAGQIIAQLRAHDPRSTGPHLHFEARNAKGGLIDPKSLLAPKPTTAPKSIPEAGAIPGRTAQWWRGSPNAMASVGQAQAAQAAQAARISNDNRSSSSVRNSSTINGGVHVHTAATDANGITRDMEDALKRRSLAAAANYGQA